MAPSIVASTGSSKHISFVSFKFNMRNMEYKVAVLPLPVGPQMVMSP